MREDFAKILETAFTKVGDGYKLTNPDEFVRCTAEILSNDLSKVEDFIEFMMEHVSTDDIKILNKALDKAILGIDEMGIITGGETMTKKEKIKNAIEEGCLQLMDEKDNHSLFSEKISKIVCSVCKKFPDSENEIMEALEEIGLIDRQYSTNLLKAFEYLDEVDKRINAMSEDELKHFAAESVIKIYEARDEKVVKDSHELMFMRFNKEEKKKYIEDSKYAEENNLFIFALTLPSNVVTALLCMEMEFRNDPMYVMKHINDKYIVVDPQNYYKWRDEYGKIKK